MYSSVLILTGPPGAGKSTVADLIARRSIAQSVHIHSDDFYGYLRTGAVDPWLPQATEQNAVVTNVMAEAASTYADGGYFTILDGVVKPGLLPTFLKAARRHAVSLDYVVLYPDVETAVRRIMTRGYGLQEERPVRDLHKEFGDLGLYVANVVDSSRLSPEGVADTIMTRSVTRDFRIC